MVVTHSDEYKKEAVKLADTVGVTAAAKQLGIHTTQIYNWRGKLRVKETRTEAEIPLMDENARLTRELAEKKQENDFLKKASAYFFSRRVIGWSMSKRMTKELACDAMQMAIDQRTNFAGVIMHTERGGQYCSKRFQAILKAK